MKQKIYTIAMIFWAATALLSCQSEPEPEAEPTPEPILLEVGASEHQFEANVRLTLAVTVSCDRPFTATSSQEWCTTEIVDRTASNLLISVSENGKTAPRSATVTISAQSENDDEEEPVTFLIEISQSGAEPAAITVKEGGIYVSKDGEEFAVQVSANFPVTFTSPAEWIYQKESNDSDNDSIFTFIAAKLPAGMETRKDSIIIAATDPEIARRFAIPVVQTTNTNLNVMTYNIYLIGGDRGASMAWDKRRNIILNIIRNQDVDILGIQEDYYSQRQWMGRNLSEYAYYAKSTDGTFTGTDAGNSIFYKRGRFTEHKSGTFWLSETPTVPGSKSWDSDGVRIASWVILDDKISGKRFLAVNTHFDYKPLAPHQAARVLITEIEKLSEDLPVVLTGDFNISPETDGIKHITNKKNSYYLVSSKYLATDTLGNTGTYHDCHDADPGDKQAIDFIFVKDGTTVLRHEVLPPIIEGIYPSDHSAVTAKINF